MEEVDVAIIGSGPAGHTAAIYTSRAGLKTHLFSGYKEGTGTGGQLMTTTEVENFPGFPDGIDGPNLMIAMQQQSERQGTDIFFEDVVEVDLQQRPFVIKGTSHAVVAKVVVISTGATAKRLGLPSEEKFWNKGMSACATCDGALPLFRDQIVGVIGGGDTAMEEALFLTRFAKKVLIIHRRDELRASKVMQERAKAHEKIEFLWNSEVVDVAGGETLETLQVRNCITGEESSVEAKGLFYAIGHEPNTKFLSGQIDLQDDGHIKTYDGLVKTNIEGVFAAGDVVDARYRQAITAAGFGCMAAMDAEKYLAELEHAATSVLKAKS